MSIFFCWIHVFSSIALCYKFIEKESLVFSPAWIFASGFLFIRHQFNEDDWNQEDHVTMAATLFCWFDSDYTVNPDNSSSHDYNLAWTKSDIQKNQH